MPNALEHCMVVSKTVLSSRHFFLIKSFLMSAIFLTLIGMPQSGGEFSPTSVVVGDTARFKTLVYLIHRTPLSRIYWAIGSLFPLETWSDLPAYLKIQFSHVYIQSGTSEDR